MRTGRRPRLPTGLLVIGVLALVALASAIIAGYWWGWTWTGIGAATETTDATRGSETTRTVRLVGPKTLWEWMSFLIVPLVLAIGGYLYHRNQQHADRLRAEHQDHTERARTQDNQRETGLQGYLDRMADLLIANELRTTGADSAARAVARARTLTILRRLDAERRGAALQFLYEAQLINKDNPIINLRGGTLAGAHLIAADLGGANLAGANLAGANLGAADLRGANFAGADLHGASLRAADLRGATLAWARLDGANLDGATFAGADLAWADLRAADLRGADLRAVSLDGARVTKEQLATCTHLNGTTLPDGTTVPDEVDNPFR